MLGRPPVGATLTATIAVRRHDGVKPIAIPGSFFKPLVRLQLSKPRGPGASELDLCCSTIRCISAVNICSRLLLRSDCQALRTIRVTGLGYGSTIPFLNRFLSRGRAPSRVSRDRRRRTGFPGVQGRPPAVPFGLTIKACSIRPTDPGLPQVGGDPVQATARSDVFQQPNQTARLDHPSKLAERRDLQRVGQYTEQKARDRCIE